MQFYSVLLKYFLNFQYFFFFEQSYEKFSGYVDIFISLNFKKAVKLRRGLPPVDTVPVNRFFPEMICSRSFSGNN